MSCTTSLARPLWRIRPDAAAVPLDSYLVLSLAPPQAMDINLTELELANRHLETEQQELEQVGCRALCVWGAEWEGGEEGRLPGLDLLR